MSIIVLVLLVVCFLVAPYYLAKFFQQIKLRSLLSDVVICFGFGILLGNTKQWWLPSVVDEQSTLTVAEACVGGSVLLAIPMLLMTSDIRAFTKYAPQLTLSFLMGVIGVLLSGVLAALWWPDLALLPQTVGILTGVYIGGSPNMVAIKYATDAPESLFLILTATDIFCGGIYFFILTAIGTKIWGVLLPKFQPEKSTDTLSEEMPNHTIEKPLEISFSLEIGQSLLLAIVCVLLGVGAGLLFLDASGNLNQLVLIVVLTLAGTLFSFYDKIRNMKGVYEFAQYLLLIFAVAIGFMADFSSFLEKGGDYTLFNAIMVVIMVVIHFIGAKLFGIDRDTFVVTSTACIYGPPFIGPICKVLDNKQLVGAGMAFGLLGL